MLFKTLIIFLNIIVFTAFLIKKMIFWVFQQKQKKRINWNLLNSGVAFITFSFVLSN